MDPTPPPPNLYRLGSNELSCILDHLELPLDRFHFSAIMQHHPNRSSFFDHQKPRCTFKRVRQLFRGDKPKYLNPPSLLKALKMTSEWTKKKDRCMECLEKASSLHLDETRDGQYRCENCIRVYYLYRKDREKCSNCGEDFCVNVRSRARGTKAHPKYISISCKKGLLWNQCAYPVKWVNGERKFADWRHAFLKMYKQEWTDFDGSKCSPQMKRITDAREYRNKKVEKLKMSGNMWMDAYGNGWDTRESKLPNQPCKVQ